MTRGSGILLPFLILLQLETIPGQDGDPAPPPPGHMMPLGSHMTPELVRRISHLPSPKEFHENYVVPKMPVIMEGALRGSPVWRKWQDDQYLRYNKWVWFPTPFHNEPLPWAENTLVRKKSEWNRERRKTALTLVTSSQSMST